MAIQDLILQEKPPALVSPRKNVHRHEDGGQELNVHTSKARGSSAMSALSPQMGILSVIIRTFKAAVTTECRAGGFGQFAWLPRFYEHVISDGNALDRIREYVLENPMNGNRMSTILEISARIYYTGEQLYPVR